VDAAPVIARGHNLAVLLPPVPAAAQPYFHAIPETRPTLVVTADADRAVALRDACPAESSVAVSGLARAQRRLAGGPPRFLLVSAADAVRLLKRSALPAPQFQTVVLAWPEQLDEEGRAALETVMAEVPRESQRMILVGVADAAAEALIQRYAFKAVAFGFPPNEGSDAAAPPKLGPATFVVARPGQLEATRRAVLDALDPPSDDAVTVAACPESREAAEALALRAAGAAAGAGHRLVLVLEPSQLAWVRGLFEPLTAMRLPTALDALERRADALRARLERTIETRNLDRELFLIGPLLGRYDPAEIAAAALSLSEGLEQTASPAPEPRPAGGEAGVPAWAKLWVGVGRKDNVRPGDVLGAIVGEAKLQADRVGKIEVRELYCLVEIQADEAERVARALTGTTLRGRRVTARIDRGHAPSAPTRPPHPGA